MSTKVRGSRTACPALSRTSDGRVGVLIPEGAGHAWAQAEAIWIGKGDKYRFSEAPLQVSPAVLILGHTYPGTALPVLPGRGAGSGVVPIMSSPHVLPCVLSLTQPLLLTASCCLWSEVHRGHIAALGQTSKWGLYKLAEKKPDL